ncbi:MAG: DUF192 domain-containing protein [Vulcanimicrobiaceae bacterium]
MIPLFALAAALHTVSVAAPNAKLTLEVADTSESREYGLMFRTALAPHHGMIFVFSSDGRQGFWMKNTLIPLDMIFVRSNGTIDSIADNVPASKAGDDIVAERVGEGKYVIELPAGEARRDGLHPGLRITIPPLEARDSRTS